MSPLATFAVLLPLIGVLIVCHRTPGKLYEAANPRTGRQPDRPGAIFQ